MVWSPCAATAVDVMVGGVPLPGVKDCPIGGNQLPLIVFSHGRRGNFLGHHDTAETLADAGFIVAALNHPGDNSTDVSRTDELSILIERAADIKRLTDYTDLRIFLDASVSFYLGHGSIAGTSYGSDEAGAQATAQSDRTKAVLVANRFHATCKAPL